MRDNQLLKLMQKDMDIEISILLRHAHRHSIPKGVIEHHDIPLSSRGRKIAYGFGKKLPSGNLVRLFWSPISRCKETVECIKKGIISNCGSAVLMGERDFLGLHPILDLNNMVRMMERIGHMKFIRKWMNGEIKRIMDDPYQVVSKIINGLVISKENKCDNRPTIDIHITHDLNVLSVIEILLKVKLETGWIDFLDGIMVTHCTNKIMLRWRDNIKTISTSSVRS